MVAFRQSLSFSSSPRHKVAPPTKAFHVRSISLPCQSHSITSRLKDEVRALRAWQSQVGFEAGSPAWLCAGLSQLELLHDSLLDFLRLRGESPTAERFLDNYLRLADAYGEFRSVIVELKQEALEAQVAMRGRDDGCLSSCVRSMKKTEKKLAKLASDLRSMVRLPAVAPDAQQAELVRIMAEVINVTTSASVSVFLGLMSLSSSSSTSSLEQSPSRTNWKLTTFKRRTCSSEKLDLEELEGFVDRIEALEGRTERVFRCLVNTRVSLLNILTLSL